MPLSDARVARSKELVARLSAAAKRLAAPVQLMEVCGTHSHALGRHGLRQVLPEGVRLISGPGCPVCVTTGGQIEMALELARRGVTVATFGDMMRVPAASGSLADARAKGADVRVVYSPHQALELAASDPSREVVFVAVGFETTAPAVASVAREAVAIGADGAGLSNFSLLCLHKTIPTALAALVADPEVRVDGLLCPGHVSVIIGADAYRSLAEDSGVPCVVAGFEPEDILLGVAMLVEQLADGRAKVENAYPRAVTAAGNPVALGLMAKVFEAADAPWRGLGVIPGSGLALRGAYRRLEAAERYGLEHREVPEPAGCGCGDVLRGKLRPAECPLFARACTPERPVGPCMVSSEGACAAAYRYERATVA